MSLTHSCMHACTHAHMHAHTHSLTHSLTHPLTHSLTHPSTHSLTHSLTHWLAHSSVVSLFIHLSIYLSVLPLGLVKCPMQQHMGYFTISWFQCYPADMEQAMIENQSDKEQQKKTNQTAEATRRNIVGCGMQSKT